MGLQAKGYRLGPLCSMADGLYDSVPWHNVLRIVLGGPWQVTGILPFANLPKGRTHVISFVMGCGSSRPHVL